MMGDLVLIAKLLVGKLPQLEGELQVLTESIKVIKELQVQLDASEHIALGTDYSQAQKRAKSLTEEELLRRCRVAEENLATGETPFFEKQEDLKKQLAEAEEAFWQDEFAKRPEHYRERGSNYGGVWVDMNTLPIGTRFHVCNRYWDDKIVGMNGVKMVLISGFEGPRPLCEDDWISIEFHYVPEDYENKFKIPYVGGKR